MSAFLLAALPSCSDDGDESEQQTEIIRIGVLMPTSGSGAGTGEAALAAADLAAADINSYLNSVGSDLRVEYMFRNTQTNGDIALEGLKEMYGNGIRFIIGPYSSASVIALKAYADSKELIVLSPSSVAPSLSVKNDNIFRLAPNDSNQAEAISALLHYDGIEVLIPVIRDDVWGNELVDVVTASFSKPGTLVADPILYSPSVSDFTALVQELSASVSDALATNPGSEIGVYMASFSEGTGILRAAGTFPPLSQVRWYGASAFAGNTSLTEDTLASAFATARSLTCPIFGYDENAKDKWEPLIQRIEQKTGAQPDIYALNAYDAMWLFTLTELSYTSAGAGYQGFSGLKTAFVQQALHFYGATGRTALNEAGDRAYAYYDFWRMTSGGGQPEWVNVAKYNNATSALTWN
jgi:branched-chain amino acid transport system substrate-binding protein